METSIAINDLPFISNLVKDYLNQDNKTKNLYSFPPTIDGLKNSYISKQKNYLEREILKIILEKNYNRIDDLSSEEIINIDLLKKNGFAITTAHQPNLFGGPLYTITKAASVISLANKMNQELGEKKIVPIYIIGSEDHDKEELLHTFLFDKKVEWNTNQTGPIGSMIVDDSFLELLSQWIASFGNLPFSEELRNHYLASYKKGNSIAYSHKNLFRAIFKNYGLIILDLNIKEVKKQMIPVFEKELKEKYSFSSIKDTLNYLETTYKVQASSREINLFEFKNGERVRISEVDENIVQVLHLQPENFSPNVILRPLMQQMIIPSIANVGGSAEVAYWLQLKSLFDKSGVDFPAIVLRDIVSPIEEKSVQIWDEYKLGIKDLFLDNDEFKKRIALLDSNLENLFSEAQSKINFEFNQLEKIINEVDKSLLGNYESEKVKLNKSMELILSKLIKAEKRNSEIQISKLEKIKLKIIENKNLNERKENFSSYYLKQGPDFIKKLIDICLPLKSEWKMMTT